VITRITTLHSRTGIPLVGGYGLAMAAMEALTRDLSAELAPHRIRVVGLRPQTRPETGTIRKAFRPRAAASGSDLGAVAGDAREQTHGKRLMTLAELADVAVFVASRRRAG
jgi:NAD(P)-dependent dehydrogenase (short-subunit alcohol dehydrogenase family)